MNLKNHSIDDLIAEINDKGWAVSGLNQMSDSQLWMASVRKPGYFVSGFGQSATAYDALKQAWEQRREPIKDRVPVVKPFTTMFGHSSHPVIKKTKRIKIASKKIKRERL